MTWIWFGLVIALLLIELATTRLVTIWYVASAIVSMILSMFINNYFVEFLVFIILGTILLFTTKPYLVKFLEKNRLNKGKRK